jgi:hypothetical protein
MVESWMANVEAEMRRTLRTISKEAVYYYPKTPRINWIHQFPGMVTLSGSQVWWTWEVEEAFRQVREGDKYAMKNLSAKLALQLSELVGFPFLVCPNYKLMLFLIGERSSVRFNTTREKESEHIVDY